MEEKVSIILPFVSLNEYVMKCITKCLELSYGNFDLILIPDEKIDLEIKDKRIKIIEAEGTISKKRNIGIRNSDANFYAFIDSDAYPDKDWLKNAIKSFTEDDILAVGGPNISPPDEGVLRKAVGNASKSILVLGTRNFRKKITRSRFCSDLPTCNLTIRKQAMGIVGFFNEEFKTGEDMEFCKRLIDKEKKIYYNNEVLVYHYDRSLFKPYFYQKLTYGASVFKILKKGMGVFNLFLLAPMIFIIFLFLGLLIGFFNKTILFLWLAVVVFYLLIVFIETKRYSENLNEVFYTLVAILMGNLSPGVGSLLSLFNPKIKDAFDQYRKR